jgi:predicted anti-sigma-YlaC factor YlaD
LTDSKRNAVAALALMLTGCAHIVEGSLANSLSQSSDNYTSDNDPQLVAAAMPFGLKTMEGLLADLPNHRGLLLASCSGFTGYSYLFVQQRLDENPDAQRAAELKSQARKLFLRARDYCLRNLEIEYSGISQALLNGNTEARRAAAARVKKEDVAVLYWCAASWALTISDSMNDLALVGQFPAVVAIAERALALDESWDNGTLEEFFVSFDAARGVGQGGGPDKAKAHYDRARELNRGLRLGVMVSYAQDVLVPAQDRAGFQRLLSQVLAFDVDRPEARPYRLANVVAQRRARWLKAHEDELFL